jgi:hypothetical protein
MELPPSIELNKRQRRLFHATGSYVPLTEVDCDSTIIELAAQRQRFAYREQVPSATDWMLGSEVRNFRKRVELFIPVAHVQSCSMSLMDC